MENPRFSGFIGKEDGSLSSSDLNDGDLIGDVLAAGAVGEDGLLEGRDLLLSEDRAPNPVTRFEYDPRVVVANDLAASAFKPLKRARAVVDVKPLAAAVALDNADESHAGFRPKNRQRLGSVDSRVEGEGVAAPALGAKNRSPSPTVSAAAGTNLAESAQEEKSASV